MESVVNIICLKWGTKYSSEFPNRLYHMVQKNMSSEFKFYCCTEDSKELRSEINVIPLPELGLETFWWKLWITSNEFPIKGKCIFLDLDIVVQNDLTKLIEYDCRDKLFLLKAQWRWDKIHRLKVKMTKTNSSVMVWDNTVRTDILYDRFAEDFEYYMFKYFGNDDYTEKEFPLEYDTLPHEWFYCRVWGYDDTVPDRMKSAHAPDHYIDMWKIHCQLYRMPERMICLFNGIRDEEGIDSRIWEGFEHYWSDSISAIISSQKDSSLIT